MTNININFSDIIYIGYDIIHNIKPLDGYMGVEYPHITIAYRPSYDQYLKIVNSNPRTFTFTVIGYGVSNTNEAIAVNKPLNCANAIAHITLSHKGRPVDSNTLDFKPIDTQTMADRNIANEYIGVLTVVTKHGRFII